MNKLKPTGNMPKDKILEDRANRIQAFCREEKRSFKSSFPTATKANTIFTAPTTPAASMTEIQVVSEGERYYMWVDLSQSALIVGQAWLRTKFGLDYSDAVARCSTMKPFVQFGTSMSPWGRKYVTQCCITSRRTTYKPKQARVLRRNVLKIS